MSLCLKVCIVLVTTIYIHLVLNVVAAPAAMDPRFELDPKIIAVSRTPEKSRQSGVKRFVCSRVAKSSSASANHGVYTVKPGDQLFKILMCEYGLNIHEAGSFSEEIKRENNILDTKLIKAGQTIIIPPIRRSSDGTLILPQLTRDDSTSNSGPDIIHNQTLMLESPVIPISEQEAVTRTRNLWDRLVPVNKDLLKPLMLQTSTFSLTLDPERYPAFASMDGGRILLDWNGSIPPLVKSLIEDKASSVRIVTESPALSKRFMASLLETAGFYSVEENFKMEFGEDPKLTIHTDFKVEKTPESLIKQDMILINIGSSSLPVPIGEFLKKEGFALYEPFAVLKKSEPYNTQSIHYIPAKKQAEMIDAILHALSVSTVKDRNIDVFEADNNGISLSVKAERYFERGGQRYIVTKFFADPVNYTLFRILETKGYNVVILDSHDDFRTITEKLTSHMKIKGAFAQHSLLQEGSTGYSLQMSGFKLDDAMLPGGGVFLTDRAMDRIFRDLFMENGFNINIR